VGGAAHFVAGSIFGEDTIRRMRLSRVSAGVMAAVASLSLGCAGSLAEGPAREMRLRHIVLYQNGLGYFERTGVLQSDRLTLQFREREVDDVLKSVVFVEEGLGPNDRPSTVTARLPQNDHRGDPEAATSVELVLTPATARPVSIAYAVPTAAWKATYRVILPAADDKKAKTVLLQAWALIDNVGDEDWNSVKITLATGAPLSYVSDLRSPTMIDRPQLTGVYGPSSQVNGPILAESTRGTDSDHDGILDAEDACPREPGTSDPGAGKNGCPRAMRVVVSSSEIRILQRVSFDKNADTVPAAAKALVSEIARVLVQNPQIRSIEIAGHASNDEKEAGDLGYRRAAAVRAALIREGVVTEMRVKSYGADRPIGVSTTEEGRKQNRRVEFQILDSSGGASSGVAKQNGEPSPVTTFAPGGFETGAMARTPAAAGAAEAVAGTLRYAIENPVTLPKKSSALITLINQAVPGEDVLFYRPDPAAPASALRPFRAARIEGRGDLGLLAGSVSVFSGGTFVGEGVLTKLSPGDTATIPYAIDGSTEVRPREDTARKALRIVTLVRGTVTVEDEETVTTTYDIQAGRLVPERLFLRHDRRGGFEVASPKKEEAEISNEAVVASVGITAGKPAKIAIVETRKVTRALELVAQTWTELGAYAEGTKLDAETKKKLSRAIELVRDLRRALDEVEEIRRRREDLSERSAELRESIRSIEKTAQAEALRKTLLERLTAATKQIDEDAEKLARRSEDVATLRAELKETLRDLRIEPAKSPEAAALPASPG
jgi:outer membrane protein OmpA-like peptidoglycan-associated protein